MVTRTHKITKRKGNLQNGLLNIFFYKLVNYVNVWIIVVIKENKYHFIPFEK